MATFGIPTDENDDIMSFSFGESKPKFRLKPANTQAAIMNADTEVAKDLAPLQQTQGRKRPKANIEQTYAAWRENPSPKNGAKLFKDLDPFVTAAVQRHTGGTLPINLGRAKSLLIDALPRYDGRASLATFVDRQLLPMQRWSAKQRAGARVPQDYAADRRRLNEVESELIDELGRYPSRAEIADKSGISLKRIEKVMRLQLPAMGDKTFTDSEDYTEAGDQAVESNNNLALLTVYYGLNPTNQLIMEHTLGLNGAPKLSNQAIAKRLRISPGAVSQRKLKIQALLDRKL